MGVILWHPGWELVCAQFGCFYDLLTPRPVGLASATVTSHIITAVASFALNIKITSSGASPPSQKLSVRHLLL